MRPSQDSVLGNKTEMNSCYAFKLQKTGPLLCYTKHSTHINISSKIIQLSNWNFAKQCPLTWNPEVLKKKKPTHKASSSFCWYCDTGPYSNALIRCFECLVIFYGAESLDPLMSLQLPLTHVMKSFYWMAKDCSYSRLSPVSSYLTIS